MFGGGVPQEDMFAKLDAMREIITEVNTQFKDPVSHQSQFPLAQNSSREHSDEGSSGLIMFVGENNIRLCLYFRVLVALRDREAHPGINGI